MQINATTRLEAAGDADVDVKALAKMGIKIKGTASRRGKFIDVEGNVKLAETLTALPPDVRFGNVTGNFDARNVALKSFLGCPVSVGGSFTSTYSKVKDFNGLPKKVGGDLEVSVTPATSLSGCPSTVGGSFICVGNRKLASLLGGPTTVGKDYSCSGAVALTELEGAPKSVPGNFVCSLTGITSFVGGPRTIGGSLDARKSKLKSYEGAPKSVGRHFSVEGVRGIKGLPATDIGGRFLTSDDIDAKLFKTLVSVCESTQLPAGFTANTSHESAVIIFDGRKKFGTLSVAGTKFVAKFAAGELAVPVGNDTKAAATQLVQKVVKQFLKK